MPVLLFLYSSAANTYWKLHCWPPGEEDVVGVGAGEIEWRVWWEAPAVQLRQELACFKGCGHCTNAPHLSHPRLVDTKLAANMAASKAFKLAGNALLLQPRRSCQRACVRVHGVRT